MSSQKKSGEVGGRFVKRNARVVPLLLHLRCNSDKASRLRRASQGATRQPNTRAGQPDTEASVPLLGGDGGVL